MSKTRVVCYSFEGDFKESEVEPILEKAKNTGVVVTYDTGRGCFVWFEGVPGKALRSLREKIKRIVVR